MSTRSSFVHMSPLPPSMIDYDASSRYLDDGRISRLYAEPHTEFNDLLEQ